MKEKTTVFGSGVETSDYGRPIYLDGCLMRFTVNRRGKKNYAEPLAYFSEKRDAEMFARAKADQLALASAARK